MDRRNEDDGRERERARPESSPAGLSIFPTMDYAGTIAIHCDEHPVTALTLRYCPVTSPSGNSDVYEDNSNFRAQC